MADVVVVGAGHNGLVAATLLARAGLAVEVLERADVVGGACRTEHPFAKVPGLATSTGSYLLGSDAAGAACARSGVELPLVRRDPHYFLPTPDGRPPAARRGPGGHAGAVRGVLLRGGRARRRRPAGRAGRAAGGPGAGLAGRAAPSEGPAERHVRPALRDIFVAMVRGSVVDYLGRFGFESETASRRCTR